MAFWSSQTLLGRLGELIDKPSEAAIDCNAIELRVGSEIYVTPSLQDVHTTTKRLLSAAEPFQIPPGQFAFILTEEVISVPPTAMAFISMKATFKMKGLVNVSGFHVDPGWTGRLIFAVFNAGPSPVHLQRGLRLFLIWYAYLDEESKERKTQQGPLNIPPAMISNLTGGHDSLYELDKRLKETKETLDAEQKKLSDRIHELDKTQTTIKVILSALLTLAGGITILLLRESIFPRSHEPATQTSFINSGVQEPAPVTSALQQQPSGNQGADQDAIPTLPPEVETPSEQPKAR
jgi:dCTP deaminase